MSSSSMEVIMTINKHAKAQIGNWGKGIEAYRRKYTIMKMGFEFGLKYRQMEKISLEDRSITVIRPRA